MPSPLEKTLKFFFSYETILPFVVSSVALSVLGSAIFAILTNEYGSKTPTLTRIAIITIFILGFSGFLVYLGISHNAKKMPSKTPEKIQRRLLSQQYKGLILLVSRIEPCQKSIQFHSPILIHCWLICSSTTYSLAEALSKEFNNKIYFSDLIVINDIYDPIEVYNRVNEIYENKPNDWAESDIIADFSGMTAHASVGMVLACNSTNRPLQYTPAQFNTEGKVIGSHNPIEVRLPNP